MGMVKRMPSYIREAMGMVFTIEGELHDDVLSDHSLELSQKCFLHHEGVAIDARDPRLVLSSRH